MKPKRGAVALFVLVIPLTALSLTLFLIFELTEHLRLTSPNGFRYQKSIFTDSRNLSDFAENEQRGTERFLEEKEEQVARLSHAVLNVPFDESNNPELLIKPSEMCTQNSLLMVTFSRPRDFLQRQLKRKILESQPSWVRERFQQIFIVGRSSGTDRIDSQKQVLDHRVLKESIEFSDILLVNIRESYSNLPQKTIASYQAFFDCQEGERPMYLIKTDMDMVLNHRQIACDLTERLIEPRKSDGESDDYNISEPVWIGHLYRRGVMPVIKDRAHKNFEDIPRKRYPAYVSGVFNVVNRRMVELVLQQRMIDRHRYRNEDAMIGIFAEKLGIEATNTRKIIVFESERHIAKACSNNVRQVAECDCRAWWAYQLGRRGNPAAVLRKLESCFSLKCENVPLH